MKKNKIRLLISTLVIMLGMSGCSFHLNHKQNNNGKIVIDYNHDLYFDNDNLIDDLLEIKDEKENKIDYSYLIDKSMATRATLAHVIDEKTVTSETNLFDFKKEKDNTIFNDELIQPIIVPQIFRLYKIENMSDLIGRYGECEINCKKLFTLDGDTLYYFDSTFTFNEYAERYLGFDIKENDTINAQVLYRFNDDNVVTILYKNQTGVESIISNVKDKNFNNENEIVIPIENTIFNEIDENYDEEYLREALDVYNGTDEFYSINNEGKDFTKYIK